VRARVVLAAGQAEFKLSGNNGWLRKLPWMRLPIRSHVVSAALKIAPCLDTRRSQGMTAHSEGSQRATSSAEVRLDQTVAAVTEIARS
jgi:hypothetical protein